MEFLIEVARKCALYQKCDEPVGTRFGTKNKDQNEGNINVFLYLQ